jgi:predicted Zn-dependent protease
VPSFGRVSRVVVAAVLALAPRVFADCATPYDCALAQVGRREFAEAIRSLERQLQSAPGDLKVLNLLGIALSASGRKEEAGARFREALALDPAFLPAVKNLAIHDYDGGRLPAARKGFDQVLAHAPRDEVAHLYLAEIDFEGKRFAAAVTHFGLSGERFTQSPLSTLHYGQALLGVGRKTEAAAVLERLPESEVARRFEAGVALGRAGAPGEAARFFASAREGYRDPAAAAYNQVLMLVEAGDAAGAIRVGEEVLAAGTRSADLYRLLSRAFASGGRIQEAYDALRAATRAEPKAVENYLDLAMLCVDHQNLDLGLEIVDIGLAQVPRSGLLHLQKGVLLALKEQMGQAEAAFEAARRLAPDQSAPFAALAMVWMQSGQTDKAVTVLRAESVRRKKDHVLPYLFAVALLRSGLDPSSPEAAEAVQALRASVRADPAFAPARGELGKLLLKRDDVDGAIAQLEKAAALDPSATATVYNLAQAYRKKGDRARVAELMARVSTLNEQERAGDPGAEMRRVVVRLVREGTESAAPAPALR